jgi:hypothetical protein
LKQRHTVHGIGRAALWVFTFSLNLALRRFVVPTRYNCVYTGRDIVKSLTYLSLEAEYAEGGLDALRKRLRRRRRPEKVPSSDSFLYRLKKLARRDALSMLQEMNREVLARAKAKGAFRRKAVAAVDLTYIPYYGRPNRYVVQGKYKLGTNRFHCYAALRLVEMGRRYVVKSRLVTPLELCEKAKIVEELVTEARRQGVHIRLLLLDKGFYSGEVIETLKALRVKFLIAVPKNSRVKEAIMGYYRTGEGRVRRFSLKKGGDRVDFNLTVHRLRRTKKGLKNILELYGAFATNLGPEKALEAWRRLPEEYRRRWGVETGFRVGKGLRAKTTSTNEEVREIYHQYAIVLENLWTLHNMGEAKRRELPLDQLRRPLVKVKEFSLDFGYFILSAYGLGPP